MTDKRLNLESLILQNTCSELVGTDI
jgi:hypothetical protein